MIDSFGEQIPKGLARDIVSLTGCGGLNGGQEAIQIACVPAIFAGIEDLVVLICGLCVGDHVGGAHGIIVTVLNINILYSKQVVLG